MIDLEPDEPDFGADLRIFAATVAVILVAAFAAAAFGLCTGEPLL